MPSTITNTAQDIKFPNPSFQTLSNFKRGVITLIDKSRTPQNALIQADNIYLYEDGQPGLRPGVAWYGSPMPNNKPIDGFDYFDFNGVIHLVVAAGGGIYRSLNDGQTWDICSGTTLTAGVPTNMNQNTSYLYLTNGINNAVRYNGTTTLQAYTPLTTPAAPTSAVTGGGTGYTSYYKIAAINDVGYSSSSPTLTVTNGVDRGSYDDSTHYVTLTLPAFQPSQTRYDIYYSTDNITFSYIDTVSSPNTTYRDDGASPIIPSTNAPTDNSTAGPLYSELINVGQRQIAMRDPTHRYRIGFTSALAGQAGNFADGNDSGYLEYNRGGKYIPIKAAEYRDGKGTPLVTVWCDSADGEGCILQMSFDTITAGEDNITVPSIYKLPGSRGTPAPGSVINVLDDYWFYNSQAFYTLGNKINITGIISTTEASANIRPTIKQINVEGEAGIAAAYVDAKILFSVNYGDSDNNATAVYDTEQNCWLPNAFTLGFQKFLKYTDTNNVHRLLAFKPGDTQLSVIDQSIQGDYGQPFASELTTGLYPIGTNRFDFQFTNEMNYEFSNPQGDIVIELLGIQRTKGYGSVLIKKLTATSTIVNAGWDTFDWDTTNWDDTSILPEGISESSVKRYSNVNKDLNAIQWHITTTSIDARYVLRTLQTWGTNTQAGHPSSWKL